jgi:hypothetical protein
MGLPSTNLTRASAAISIIALAIVSISDFVFTGFWDQNAMATSVLADLLVLVVGVAVVNEFLTARARREWRLLSDYGLVELGEIARHTWVMLAQNIGAGKRESLTLNELRDLVRSPKSEEMVRELALAAARDDERRRSLHELVSEIADDARARLGRWAPILLETKTVLWEDAQNWRPSYEGSGDNEWIADRVAKVIRLGSSLDVELLETVEHPDRWGWGPHSRGPEPAG